MCDYLKYSRILAIVKSKSESFLEKQEGLDSNQRGQHQLVTLVLLWVTVHYAVSSA